ncbi:hypothetical protein [Burkholderia gladioli]|uniref:hypothetical protein n=1 Tax=Burkholderia gladioli TaxID=28095 RepID=UPI001FC8319E|nr:hypothetical protein [Burkholderia gladioli]
MIEHKKSPAQGGEMPPVERAAITGSGGIDTVRGAKPADNAAQERNTNAAALDRDIAHLIDCSEGGIARVPRETLVRLRALLTAPRAGLPRHVLASLECTAVWLEKDNDPQDAARELRACLAKIDAAPAAPVAEPAPDPLRRRVERLLVELHAEGRLSEGQCAKMLDISRVDWRDLAEFLAPAAQAVAADGAATDQESALIECVRVLESCRLLCNWPDMRTAIDGAIKLGRAAVSPATAETCAGMPDEVRDSLLDSQYLAGVTAGWNAANADDPNAALGKIHASRAGYLRPLRDWQKAGRPGVPASPATADVHAAFLAWTVDPSFYDWNKTSQCYAHHFNAGFKAARASQEAAPAEMREQFQARVQPWMMECFGPTIAADRVERNHRFLEEALELVQSLGCTASEAHQLVDYTFGRSIGEPAQEVGGVMVTLAALCLASRLDMHQAGETELARISAPSMVEKIRAKQAAKPKHSPLPQAVAARARPTNGATPARWRRTKGAQREGHDRRQRHAAARQATPQSR